MKAVEFIAKFGWDASFEVFKNVPTHENSSWKYFIYYGSEIDMLNESDYKVIEGNPPVVPISELVKYIHAYRFIQNLGGIQAAKDAAYQNTMNVDGFDPSKIESAIALVEEVERFKGVAL